MLGVFQESLDNKVMTPTVGAQQLTKEARRVVPLSSSSFHSRTVLSTVSVTVMAASLGSAELPSCQVFLASPVKLSWPALAELPWLPLLARLSCPGCFSFLGRPCLSCRDCIPWPPILWSRLGWALLRLLLRPGCAPGRPSAVTGLFFFGFFDVFRPASTVETKLVVA